MFPENIAKYLVAVEDGEVVRAGIYTYGETIHMFVERKNYQGTFMPGFKKWESDYNPSAIGLKYIDHMVGNVGWGEMDIWVKWYEDVMGFENFLSFQYRQTLKMLPLWIHDSWALSLLFYVFSFAHRLLRIAARV